MSLVSSQGGTSKKKTKKKIYGRKVRKFCFWKNKFSSFVYSQSGTYYALFLGCFDLKFYQIFLIACIVLWLRFEPQICSTRFWMNILFVIATTEMKVRFCVKLFDHFLTEYCSVRAKICRVSYVLWIQSRRHVQKENTEKDIRK